MKNAPLKFFVLGTPITHSLSPLMHNAAFEAARANATFEARDPRNVEGFLALCDEFASQAGAGVGGFCVTIPYKQEAFKRCEILSPAARVIGAVNTVTCQSDGLLKGDNTDAIGFVHSLAHELGAHDLQALSNHSTALVVGTGGVARAIAYALINSRISSVTVSSRHLQSAQDFIASLNEFAQTKGVKLCACEDATHNAVGEFDVVVNATPLGLRDDDPAFAEAPWLKAAKGFVFDAVYRKEHATRLVREARLSGVPACDGRRMLVEQGIAAQNIWNETFHFWDNETIAAQVARAMYESVLTHGEGESK